MTAMTPRERAMAAFEHRPTDRAPVFHSGLSSWAGSFILGREAYVGGGIQQWRESAALWEGEEAHQEFLERSRRDAFDLTRVLDQEIVRVRYWRMGEKPTRRIDAYTFQYGDPDGPWRVMRQLEPQAEMGLQLLAGGGDFASNQIVAGTSPENMEAMQETIDRYR